MIKKRYHRQKDTRRNGLDRSFMFFQCLPRRTKYIVATCIGCAGITGLIIPVVPGWLLILTSVSIFAPSRYIRYIGFHYRSLAFIQTITDYQSHIEQNFRITPKIVFKSFQLKIKKRMQ